MLPVLKNNTYTCIQYTCTLCTRVYNTHARRPVFCIITDTGTRERTGTVPRPMAYSSQYTSISTCTVLHATLVLRVRTRVHTHNIPHVYFTSNKHCTYPWILQYMPWHATVHVVCNIAIAEIACVRIHVHEIHRVIRPIVDESRAYACPLVRENTTPATTLHSSRNNWQPLSRDGIVPLTCM